MNHLEYLLSYGTSGEFGRFRAAQPLDYRRGDRAVVRSHRGLELGQVLCPATPGHARVLPNTTVGTLLRLATADDQQAAEAVRVRAGEVFTDARRLAGELGLALEVLDVEVLLDGEHAILHHLPWDDFDERPLVAALTRRHGLHLRLHTLRGEPEPEGCGEPNCGKKSGSCGSCSSGGCGSSATGAEDVQKHFADLRERMPTSRVPLF